MSELDINSAARHFAAELNCILWEGIPWGGATTLAPESLTMDDFLAIVGAVGASILYLDPDGSAMAFACSGVIHVFAGPAERARLTGTDAAHDIAFDDVDGFDLEGLSIRVGGGRDFDDPYFDWETHATVSGHVREAVDALVADQRFNGYRSGHVLADHVTNLNAEDAAAVERVARRVFNEGVGKQLDHEAGQLVQSLVRDPAYDPLAWGDEISAFVAERIKDEDPRLIDRVEQALSSYAYESGERAKAERRVAQRAEAILLALSPSDRDLLGFASKNAVKVQLLADYLEGETGSRAERLAREVARLEDERFGISREERYATAARRLQATGMTRAEVSRRLGVSSSILDRITTTHRRDRQLDTSDPIMTELVPGVL